jgi:tetratricopeptide (TPR) repeat protein
MIQGLTNLVAAWRSLKGANRWVLVCDDLDKAGVLVRRFYSELLRRKGVETGLILLGSTSPGFVEATVNSFGPALVEQLIRLDLPASFKEHLSPDEAFVEAERLEREVGEDPLQIELNVARLIFLWRCSGYRNRALQWEAAALGLYNHLGCYEDGASFIEPVLANLEILCQEAKVSSFWHMTRWNIVGNIYGCLNSIGRPQQAFEVVEQNMELLSDACEQARALYLLAMSCARFLPRRDLARAEVLLKQGLEKLEADSSESNDRIFLRSFLMNGLAFVRHRQGLPMEAVDLCRAAHANLERNLAVGEHKLHRSVLFYNLAQVFASTGNHAEAIMNYSAAIEMDPNYSEYFNERGSILLAMKRFSEAEADFRRAIDLSPPYPQVWTNLGQCYNLMEAYASAIQAYDNAIDLNPGDSLSWIGRAQAHQRLGHTEAALKDYSMAVGFEPENPLLLSNRAAVLWEIGRLDEALKDLEQATALDPGNAALSQNRMFVAQALAERRSDRSLAGT